MTYNNIAEIFPSANWDAWYEGLASAFGSWSARYWEQRAIMNRQAGKLIPESLSRAESFALRAVSIVRDAFSLTTLGTVLLAKAAYSVNVDVGEYYDRAVDAFEAASADDPHDIVIWIAFLRNSLDVLKRVQDIEPSSESDLEERLNDDWRRIHAQISSVGNASEATRQDLGGLMRRYMHLTQGDS